MRHRAALAPQPQRAHDLIQAGLAFAAQGKVQAQGHQRALGVVADRRVGGVFVLAVVLDPGVKAGLRHGLHGPAWCLEHLVDGFGDELQVRSIVNQPCSAQQQIVVVTGKALEKPQQLRVVFAGVVVLGKFGGAQPLDVPRVEVLVADQAQQCGVSITSAGLIDPWQVAPATDERGGVAVLQPSVAVAHGVEHEQVALERRLAFAMPEADCGLANLLGVCQQALAIKRGRCTSHHKAVRNAAGREAADPEEAHFHRAVNQLVVVRRSVETKTLLVCLDGGQAGGH